MGVRQLLEADGLGALTVAPTPLVITSRPLSRPPPTLLFDMFSCVSV